MCSQFSCSVVAPIQASELFDHRTSCFKNCWGWRSAWDCSREQTGSLGSRNEEISEFTAEVHLRLEISLEFPDTGTQVGNQSFLSRERRYHSGESWDGLQLAAGFIQGIREEPETGAGQAETGPAPIPHTEVNQNITSLQETGLVRVCVQTNLAPNYHMGLFSVFNKRQTCPLLLVVTSRTIGFIENH